MSAQKKRQAGGPPLTADRWRELGKTRIELMISLESLTRLDALCAESGFSRREQVEALIDCEPVSQNAKKPPSPKR